MFNKFNEYINEILLNAVESSIDKDEKRIREVYHCNEFYHRYLETLMDKINENKKIDELKLIVTKQRQNTFLVTGILKDVMKFFTDFKIDEAFMEEPKDFRIFAPQYMLLELSDDIHYMGRGEMWPKQDFNVPSTHDIDNKSGVRSTVFGKWFSFYEDDAKGLKVKGVKPSDLNKNFKKLKKESSIDDDTIFSVEFSVNCEQWHNQIFDEMSEYSNVEWRDDVNSEHDDFDYSVALKPVKNPESKEMTDAEIKKAINEINRKEKTFKENKVK
jgi:hypothetical protein